MTAARPPVRPRSVQNGSVSPWARSILACAVLLGGCGWDGPTAAVRVVPEGAVDDGSASGRGDEGVGASADAGDNGDAGDGDHDPDATTSAGHDSSGGDERTSSGTGTGAHATDAAADLGITPPFPDTVAVVGDSLTLSASDEITSELAGLGLDVLVVDGVESRRMTAGSALRPSGLEAIRTIRDELDRVPEMWVIALGTNDVGAQVDVERFRDDVRAALAVVGDDTPVVWVDIWIRDRRDAAVAANDVIRDEVAARTAPSGVVGWFAHGGDDALVTDDGIHLTSRGQVAFATAIANRVRTIYRR